LDRAGAKCRKYFVGKDLGRKNKQKNMDHMLDMGSKFGYNTCMKYIVIRYHSSPVTFSSRLLAEEFAMNCGDFSDLLAEKA
jgi:hypothetical protein